MRKRCAFGFATSLALVACGGEETLPVAPTAIAGYLVAAPVGATAFLDGSASSDVQRRSLEYHWSLVQHPTGAPPELTLQGSEVGVPLPRAGRYDLKLVVVAGEQVSAPDVVSVYAIAQRPVAGALAPFRVAVGDDVRLSKEFSRDPVGAPMTFTWTSIRSPSGPPVQLNLRVTGDASFTATELGTYRFSLVAHNGVLESLPHVLDVVVGPRPDDEVRADAGPDRSAALGEVIELDGSGSSEPHDRPIEYTWQLLRSPDGARPRLAGAGPRAMFVGDRPGEYQVRLTARADGPPASDEVVIRVVEGSDPLDIVELAHDVSGIAYDEARGRIALVSQTPPALHLRSSSGDEVTLPLPSPPTAVALSRSGRYAAVVMLSGVARVDLDTSTIGPPIRAMRGAVRVAISDDGWAYASTFARDLLVAVDTSSATITEHERAADNLVLLESKRALYVAGPTRDVTRYDVSFGAPSFVRTRRFDICGGFWRVQSGELAVTGCGELVYLSDDPRLDLQHAGTLEGATELAVASGSGVAPMIASIPDPVGSLHWPGAGRRVHLHDAAYGRLLRVLSMPNRQIDSGSFPWYARSVFVDGADDRVVFLLEGGSGRTHRFAIATSRW